MGSLLCRRVSGVAVVIFATVGGCGSPNAPPTGSAFALVQAPGLDTTGAFFDVEFVSANGSTVIGTLYHPGSGGPRIDLFRWTTANGLAVLDSPAAPSSQGKLFASSLSKVALDGDVLAGFALVAVEGAGAASMAFRWAPTSGATTLPAPLDQTPFSIVDMSSDGQTIVGTTGGHAFRWTNRDGMQALGALAGDRQSVAVATSADGGTVVGLSSSADAEPFSVAGWKPFKWTQANGSIPLEVPTGMTFCNSRPGLTSADGGTTFGRCSSSSSQPGGVFRWRGNAVEALGALPPESSGDPRFMTDDGSVVVGSVQPMRQGGVSASFRWSETAGLELLPSSFKMLAMNRDATVIVGQAGALPARWEEATGHTERWPIPSGFEDGRPLSVTDDGALSAGEVSASAGGSDETRRTEAAVWDDTDGVRLVRDVLLARGADLRGATLVTARISPDGTTLSGTATMQTRNDALWVARLSP